jgi:hypothetical protein
MALIHVLAAAVSKWVESYNRNPARWEEFAMRYDLTVSDSRVLYLDIPEEEI